MSKNHNKELRGVYKRCLSALSQSYKLQKPNSEQCAKLAKIAAKEASQKVFASKDKKDQWIKYRVEELYNEVFAKANVAPYGQLKKQIEEKIARLG